MVSLAFQSLPQDWSVCSNSPQTGNPQMPAGECPAVAGAVTSHAIAEWGARPESQPAVGFTHRECRRGTTALGSQKLGWWAPWGVGSLTEESRPCDPRRSQGPG